MVTPLAPGHSEGRMRPLTAARLVNLYPEIAPQGARSQLVAHGTPGLRPFASCGTGPGRKVARHDGHIYVVSGSELYRVARDGTSTLCTGSGPATGLVTMASDGTDLVVVADTTPARVNGTSVSALPTPFPPSSVDYVDGYMVYTEADTGKFFIGGLHDAGAFDATEFASAEGWPDDVLRVFTDHREVWLFGEQTTEVWFNTGGADFPFTRVEGAYMERGIAAAGAVAKADNTVYWLGDDKIVYRAAGYVPQRVSTHAEEEAIRKMVDVSDCTAFVDRHGGHTFVVFRFPSGGRTFVFDAASGLWHERQSGVGEFAAWRIADVVQAWGKSYGVDAWTGALFQLDIDTYTDNGAILRRVARTPPLASEMDRYMRVHAVQLMMEAGPGLLSGQGSDPQAMLRVSRDGGQTFGVELMRAIGPRGQYLQRAIWRRLGILRNGCLEVVITDPVKVSVAGLAAQIEELVA